MSLLILPGLQEESGGWHLTPGELRLQGVKSLARGKQPGLGRAGRPACQPETEAHMSKLSLLVLGRGRWQGCWREERLALCVSK